MPKSMKKRPSGRKIPSAVSKKSPAKSKPTSPRKGLLRRSSLVRSPCCDRMPAPRFLA